MTLARGLISLALFAFIPLGIKNIGLGVILYIVGWTTDILDGRIARATGNEGRLARWDFPLDMILTGAGAAYCAYMGIIPGLFFWIWGILWLLLAIITRNQAVIMLTAFVCHVVSGVGLAKASPLWFWVLVAWIALVLALDFRRFGQVVMNFIRSAREWIRR
jgi:phosphatidylglycerophosphate synthase